MSSFFCIYIIKIYNDVGIFMKTITKVYCRVHQAIFRFAMLFLPIPIPQLTEGNNALENVDDILILNNCKKPLIVTDEFLFSSGLILPLINSLEKAHITYSLYKDVKPNPSIEEVSNAYNVYKNNDCDSLIAFGGGSPIDTAKAVGARVARHGKAIEKMKGNLKVMRKLPLLIAIPTTAGTGSETTLAAVISNHKTHEKYPINDPHLIPKFAILDPSLTIGLPKNITSTTGMDALTHAIEAYIGKSNTRFTKTKAREAVSLIFNNLYEAYTNPTNLTARNNMLIASFYAGLAFTRAYVGYVHAIAHTLGGFYNVPHGLANAVLLPIVLEHFGSSVYKPLSELADLVQLTDKTLSQKDKAVAFINEIKLMNQKMNIPTGFPGVINDEDISMMIIRADKESNPLYPVPKLFSHSDFYQIILKIK